MQLKVRYESFDQFFRLNVDNFKLVQSSTKQLKSPQELGMTGEIFLEAERLAFYYLKLKSVVSDLLFAVGASVLDAKHRIKTETAIVFRELSGAQGDKKTTLEADARIIKANQSYNDLLDLQEYLCNKRDDFANCHYYYKNMTQEKG
jgi:hypothetical protein